MTLGLHQLTFDGAILARGFWLYIWEISVNDGRTFYYVGKTGDKASRTSQSPFDRLSKHLGSNDKNNALRQHLATRVIEPEDCRFRFYAYGPLFQNDFARPHAESCDIMSGLEKALADAMAAAGYNLLNTVKCRMPLDQKQFEDVKAAFSARFPMLQQE